MAKILYFLKLAQETIANLASSVFTCDYQQQHSHFQPTPPSAPNLKINTLIKRKLTTPKAPLLHTYFATIIIILIIIIIGGLYFSSQNIFLCSGERYFKLKNDDSYHNVDSSPLCNCQHVNKFAG